METRSSTKRKKSKDSKEKDTKKPRMKRKGTMAITAEEGAAFLAATKTLQEKPSKKQPKKKTEKQAEQEKHQNIESFVSDPPLWSPGLLQQLSDFNNVTKM
jgi:hypothetical protein